MNPNTKKILIVTYYFPPKPYVASLRFRGLAKYLPEFGWEPVFVTPQLPGQVDPRYRVVQIPEPLDVFKRLKKKLGLDPAKRIQEHIKVPASIRQGKRSITNSLELYIRSIVLFPGKNKGWCPVAIKAANELLEKEKFHAIISSSPYPQTHIIANELKAQHGLNWIADFRDLWTQAHFYKKSSAIKYFERKLEVKTLSSADALVTVSEPLAEKLCDLHNRKDVFAIPNGFDPDEYQKVELTKEFTITYTGMLHPGNQDPTLLFQAVRELIEAGSLDPAITRIRFYGPVQYWIEKEIKQYRVEEITTHFGIVPRDIALQKQRESQVLLLLDWQDPKEQGVYTGKIFEYLLARRPVLAVGGGKGVVKELLETTNAGRHASNLAAVKNALVKYYEEYKLTGKVSYEGKEEQIDKYTHRQMAKKFSDVLNSISGK